VSDEHSASSGPDAIDRVVTLGRIAGSFGVSGWVKVQSYTDPPDNILDYDELQLLRAGQWTQIDVEDGRATGKGVLLKLSGIESPEQAQGYSGAELGVRRSELPPVAPGEYYWSDLEGLEAVTPTGELLGFVDHFRLLPANPLVVIRGEREHLIPFVKERIVAVDLDARRIVLDWSADW
jgi:16S rRNA processing protein RimM